MAIDIPRIGDRSWDQLIDALRRQLPTDEWTDHNASDPGITLLELLAWLGEMALYRMDRIPPTHRARFLDLLIEPPQPVTALLRFEAQFTGAATSQPVPAGTLVATDYSLGRRFVFETYKSITLARPALPSPPVATRFARARAILEVFNEPLGVSDGQANQAFELRPPRAALGITDPEAPAPILTDFVHRTAGYEPNPTISVGGDAGWSAVPSLLTEATRVGAPGSGKFFAVEAAESRIRFGDGSFGAIPPIGAVITATRYAVLDGPHVRPPAPPVMPRRHALTVRENEIRHVLNPVSVPGSTLSVGNTDAEGGESHFPESVRIERGLQRFRTPYRLITERDFSRTILRDFNAFQVLSEHAPGVLRASALFDTRPLDPSGVPTELVDAPSWVTLVLIAGDPVVLEEQLRDPARSLTSKQLLVTASETLWQRLLRFLEPRRLITTRIARLTPRLRELSLTATVAAARDSSLVELETRVRDAIRGFLSPVSGGPDGAGWPLGGHVYRSRLFRLIEDLEGVDHVAMLTLTPADADGNAILGPQELPLLQNLTLTIVRS